MSGKEKKVAIVSVTNDLVSDQRVHKTCLTLCEMNYEVILVGRRFKYSLPVQREYKTKRFKLIFNKKALFYAEYNIRLFFYLLLKKNNILISNDLDTLVSNYLVSKIKRIPLIYDSHEYFTEVPELINRPKVKKVWQFIEKLIVPKLKFGITVNDSLAEIYSTKYQIPFFSIRNVPSISRNLKNDLSSISLPFDSSVKNILLYQGSLNVGRGLEKLIRAIKLLDNSYGLLLIGTGDIEKNLRKEVLQLNIEDRVKFLGKIQFSQLYNYTIKAHLGFSIEENMGLNYYYALPNKIFDYIHAEVPVICSAFPEMKNIVEKNNIGIAINTNNEYQLADIIQQALSDKDRYAIWKENCKLLKQELNWEIEKEKLKKIFE